MSQLPLRFVHQGLYRACLYLSRPGPHDYRSAASPACSVLNYQSSYHGNLQALSEMSEDEAGPGGWGGEWAFREDSLWGVGGAGPVQTEAEPQPEAVDSEN